MNKLKLYLLKLMDESKARIINEADAYFETVTNNSKRLENQIEKYEDRIQEQKNELDSKIRVKEEKEKEVDTIEENIRNLKNETKLIEDVYRDCKDYGPEIPEAYGLYDRVLLLENSIVYKKRIDEIREKEKTLIREKRAIVTEIEWKVNDSKREGNKLVNRVSKIAMRAFNGECDAIIESVKSYSKIESKNNKLVLIFKTINELIDVLHLRITQDYLMLKIQELELVCEYENALQKEKDELKRQRENERDEEIAHKEYLREIKRIEKEETHFSNEIAEMVERMKGISELEKSKYLEKIELLERKISELNGQKEDYKNRFENKAGYVYIISNIGSFGENVFKIGTTRRIDPYERINELSNASVPFRFDSHAVMFCENCYEVEHELHKVFEKNRVNRVNLWKEYFRVDFDILCQEIIKRDSTVKIYRNPEAFEYRQ